MAYSNLHYKTNQKHSAIWAVGIITMIALLVTNGSPSFWYGFLGIDLVGSVFVTIILHKNDGEIKSKHF